MFGSYRTYAYFGIIHVNKRLTIINFLATSIMKFTAQITIVITNGSQKERVDFKLKNCHVQKKEKKRKKEFKKN